MSDHAKPTATISMAMKLNLGNYESAEVFMSIAGISEDTTEQEIDLLLDNKAKVAYDHLKARLNGRLQEIVAKRKGGKS